MEAHEIIFLNEGKVHNCLDIYRNKPQMKTPRVAPLEGASTSTVAPVDVAHTYGSPPYVDIAGRYAPAGAYVSMHCGGHDADEHRYQKPWLFIKFTLFISGASRNP